MNLAIDFGNTSAKIGIIEDQQIINVERFDYSATQITEMEKLIQNASCDSIYYINVRPLPISIDKLFATIKGVKNISHDYPFPFEIQYQPSHHAGIDRLMGVAGGMALFPRETILVIQVGTCITYDVLLNGKTYVGGAISPGIHIRNHGMHTFTHQLPLIVPNAEHTESVIASTTDGSLQSGIMNGILFEIEGYIRHIEQKSGSCKTILSGGDMIYFAKKIKSQIFANANITIIGLQEIITLDANSTL